MDKDIAEAAMKFMMRVQLTGQEVPAFNAVMRALEQIAMDNATTQSASDRETDHP